MVRGPTGFLVAITHQNYNYGAWVKCSSSKEIRMLLPKKEEIKCEVGKKKNKKKKPYICPPMAHLFRRENSERLELDHGSTC